MKKFQTNFYFWNWHFCNRQNFSIKIIIILWNSANLSQIKAIYIFWNLVLKYTINITWMNVFCWQVIWNIFTNIDHNPTSFLFLSILKHCVKSVQNGVYSGPYFPAFGLNTKIYAVNLRIQSKCGKIRTRKNSVFGHFSRSEMIRKIHQLTFVHLGK